MPVRISDEVKASVLEANHFCPSFPKIQQHLAKSEIIVSCRTIYWIIAAKESGGKSGPARKKNATNPGSPIARTPALITKVASDVKTPDPQSQRDLFRKHEIAKGTVSASLKKDLGLNFKKKVTTHLLLPHQAVQRFERGPRFLRCISRCKLPLVLTFDETYLSMNSVNGQTKGYYESKENPAPEKWKKKLVSGWPAKIMVGMGICLRGKTWLYSFPPPQKLK